MTEICGSFEVLDARSVAREAIRNGWIVLPKPAPTAVKPVRKYAFRVPHTTGGLVKSGRALAQPFTRAELCAEASVNDARASNAMTAWRKAGWIVKDGKGWVRTSAFGGAA